MIRNSGCSRSTVSRIEVSSSRTPTISISGWSEIVAITSSRISRGRFATKTLIFSTPTPQSKYLLGCRKEQVQLRISGRAPGTYQASTNNSGQSRGKVPSGRRLSTKTVLFQANTIHTLHFFFKKVMPGSARHEPLRAADFYSGQSVPDPNFAEYSVNMIFYRLF